MNEVITGGNLQPKFSSGRISTEECVLAIAMAHRTGMEAIDRNLLYGGTDLFGLTAAEWARDHCASRLNH
jgi:hypothetical protein